MGVWGSVAIGKFVGFQELLSFLGSPEDVARN